MLVALALGLLLAGGALLLPGRYRLAIAVAAFVCGVGFERYRQGGRDRPLTLAESPALWWATLRHSIGLPYAFAALAATAAALTVLLLPSLRPDPKSVETTRRPVRPTAVLPELPLRIHRLGKRFVISKASFRVLLADGQPWAEHVRAEDPGPGRRWVTLVVESRNLGRPNFDPNRLSYRLGDERGNLYSPDLSGGTGPGSLSTKGRLRRGEAAEARLGFRVPASARALVLVFEPTPSGDQQVRVPLGRRR